TASTPPATTPWRWAVSSHWRHRGTSSIPSPSTAACTDASTPRSEQGLQPQVAGAAGELGLAARPRLGVDVGEVPVHGALTDVELVGDLPGGEPLGGEAGHLALAW